MNPKKKDTVKFFKHFITIMLFFTVMLEQSIQTASFLVDISCEIGQFNGEEESEEKNHKGDDSKSEKNKLYSIYSYTPYDFKIKLIAYNLQKTELDFCIEIPIPPPDKA